jgi:hypothetical protein
VTANSLDQEQALRNWLVEVGFVKGNPFAEFDAYFEIPELPIYFQDTRAYHAIVGDPHKTETKIIFGPRGSGKTAHWTMLLQESQPAKSSGRLGKVLSVPHIRYERIWELYRTHQRISSLDHVRMILQYGTRNLLTVLTNDANRARKFPSTDMRRLRWFCDEFDPELLEADSVKRHIERIMGKFPFKWEVFSKALERHDLTRRIKQHNAPPGGIFLAHLVDTLGRPQKADTLADELMAEFVELVRLADLDAVYILMDQLDATTQAQQNPELVMTLIEPLLEDQHLVNANGWAFKIFLPDQVRSLLLKPGTRLAEFVKKHELQIDWRKETLRELLHSRLRYFSDEKCESLEELVRFEGSSSRLQAGDNDKESFSGHSTKSARTIEEDMLNKADGLPRRLLQFGKYLFEVCATRSKGKEILTWGDWNQALARFSGDMVMGPILLSLDSDAKCIFKGQWPIQLTDMEYEFLKCLKEHDGRCDRETLVKAVWGPGAEDDPQVVGQLVKRIREKIENDRDHPTYLVTERGFGYRLNLQGTE